MNRKHKHETIHEEKHPLLKNFGFNAIFLVFLVGVLFLFGSSIIGTDNAGKEFPRKQNSLPNIAGVGATLSDNTDASNTQSETASTTRNNVSLPFSDEVVITNGSTSDSIIVRPIFKTGVGEKSYEYKIVAVPVDGDVVGSQ